MKSIGELIIERPKTKISNQRQYVLSQFLEEINKDLPEKYLKNGKWKVQQKMTARQLGVLLSHVSIPDLYVFLSECRDYEKTGKGKFGKIFWGKLKIKNEVRIIKRSKDTFPSHWDSQTGIEYHIRTK